MTGSLYIYFPLASVVFGIFSTVVLYRILHGRIAVDIAFFLLSASSWSFFIFFEILLENNILLPLLNGSAMPYPLAYLSPYIEGPESVFLIIKLSSTMAGFMAMFIPLALLRISLNFPPRNMNNGLDIALITLAILMALPSWLGVHFELTPTGIKRTADSVIMIQLVYVIIFCILSQLLLIIKSKNFSSPLRQLEAKYVPMAFFTSIIIGGGFGYLAAFIPQTTPALIIATSAPVWFTLIIFTGFGYSRQILGKTFDYKNIDDQLTKTTDLKEKMRVLLMEDIHLSLYGRLDKNSFINIHDKSDEIQIPDEILKYKKEQQAYSFFAEDFDDSPELPGHIFMSSNYVQAGMLHDNNLLLVHRIKNNKILTKKDLNFLYNKLLTNHPDQCI